MAEYLGLNGEQRINCWGNDGNYFSFNCRASTYSFLRFIIDGLRATGVEFAQMGKYIGAMT